MKNKHWMWMLVVVALWAVGCGSSPASDPSIATAEQSLVVEIGDAQLLARSAHVDLTRTHVVYVLESSDAAKLRGLEVLTDEGAVSLVDLVGPLAEGAQSIVLGADPARVDAYLAGEGATGAAVSTADGLGVSVQALRKLRCCDSCTDLSGGGIGPLYCTGCGACDD